MEAAKSKLAYETSRADSEAVEKEKQTSRADSEAAETEKLKKILEEHGIEY